MTHAVETALLAKIETKVKASTTVAALTGLVTSALAEYVFHGAVPSWVGLPVGAVVTGLLTFAAGYLAKHTPRLVNSVNTEAPVAIPDTALPGAVAGPTDPPSPFTPPKEG